MLGSWFSALWNSLPSSSEAKKTFVARLQDIVEHKASSLIYHLIIFHLFKDLGEELDEERIVKSATGIRNTVVWKKLFKFQRDGVIGAIDKLERHRGCIIADSVGLEPIRITRRRGRRSGHRRNGGTPGSSPPSCPSEAGPAESDSSNCASALPPSDGPGPRLAA
jgi:hypothetical protein